MMPPITPNTTVRLPQSVTKRTDPLDRGANIGRDNPMAQAAESINRASVGAAGGINTLTSAISLVPGPVGLAATGFNLVSGAMEKAASAVQDFVVGTSQAIASLSNAGKSLLQLPLNSLSGVFASISTNIADLVKSASPGVFARFKLAMDDFTASIGRNLIPVLDQATQLVRQIGGVFYGLSGPASALLKGMTAAIPILTAVAGAFTAVAFAASGIGPVLTATTAALVGMQVTSQNMGPVVKKFAEIFAAMTDRIGQAAVRIQGTAQPLIDVLFDVGEAFASFVGEVADMIKSVGPAFDDFKLILISLKEAVTPLAKAFGQIALSGIGGAISGIANTVQQATPYIIAFAKVVGELVNELISWVSSILGLGGLPSIPQAPRQEVPNNTGAAARSTSSGSAEDVLRKARESAFSLGGGSKPEDQTAKNTADINKAIQQQLQKVDEIFTAITNIPTVIEGYLTNVQEGIVSGVQTGLNTAAQFVTGVITSIVPGLKSGVSGGIISGSGIGGQQSPGTSEESLGDTISRQIDNFRSGLGGIFG